MLIFVWRRRYHCAVHNAISFYAWAHWNISWFTVIRRNDFQITKTCKAILMNVLRNVLLCGIFMHSVMRKYHILRTERSSSFLFELMLCFVPILLLYVPWTATLKRTDKPLANTKYYILYTVVPHTVDSIRQTFLYILLSSFSQELK